MIWTRSTIRMPRRIALRCAPSTTTLRRGCCQRLRLHGCVASSLIQLELEERSANEAIIAPLGRPRPPGISSSSSTGGGMAAWPLLSTPVVQVEPLPPPQPLADRLMAQQRAEAVPPTKRAAAEAAASKRAAAAGARPRSPARRLSAASRAHAGAAHNPREQGDSRVRRCRRFISGRRRRHAGERRAFHSRVRQLPPRRRLYCPQPALGMNSQPCQSRTC